MVFLDLDQVFQVQDSSFSFSRIRIQGFSWFGPLLGFSGSGLFRLLIQRCKIPADANSFFDQNAVLPDERKIYPMKGLKSLLLLDVKAGRELFLMAFADGDGVALYVYRIAPDVVDLIDIDDIGAMDFYEGRSTQLFFHAFQGTVGNIGLAGGDELDIVPHALHKKDILFF